MVCTTILSSKEWVNLQNRGQIMANRCCLCKEAAETVNFYCSIMVGQECCAIWLGRLLGVQVRRLQEQLRAQWVYALRKERERRCIWSLWHPFGWFGGKVTIEFSIIQRAISVKCGYSSFLCTETRSWCKCQKMRSYFSNKIVKSSCVDVTFMVVSNMSKCDHVLPS